MSDNPSEIHVPVYGLIESRPEGDLKAEWQTVRETPGRFPIQRGQVYKFTFLGVLDVRDRDIEQLVESLSSVISLKYLDLQGCEITDRGFKHVATLHWIESLKFSGMTDRSLTTVASLTKLRFLDVFGSSRVTDRGLAHLSKLTQLNDLTLRACSVTDRGLKHLSNLEALEGIDLGGCRDIGDRGVAILAALPKLTAIWLLGCWKITDRGIASLAAMPSLTHLALCRSNNYFGRLLRRFGIGQNTEIGSFSEKALQRLIELHPNCDLTQPIDWKRLEG